MLITPMITLIADYTDYVSRSMPGWPGFKRWRKMMRMIVMLRTRLFWNKEFENRTYYLYFDCRMVPFAPQNTVIFLWILCAESEKPRQRVSNADRKVFANPESFCNKLIICWRISGYFGKCPDTIQNIQIICKVGMNWKFSIWCKKCPDNLKNVSGYSKKSLDNVKMYLENLEGSGWS